MAPIQHFAPPAAIKAPPLSFATRTGDLLFVSGMPGLDQNGALPDTFEAQFGCVAKHQACTRRSGREFSRPGQGQRAVDACVRCRRDECTVCFRLWASPLSCPHDMRGAGAAEPRDADRDRVRGIFCRALIGCFGRERPQIDLYPGASCSEASPYLHQDIARGRHCQKLLRAAAGVRMRALGDALVGAVDFGADRRRSSGSPSNSPIAFLRRASCFRDGRACRIAAWSANAGRRG